MSNKIIIPISKCFNEIIYNPIVRNKILKVEYNVGNLSSVENTDGFDSVYYSSFDPTYTEFVDEFTEDLGGGYTRYIKHTTLSKEITFKVNASYDVGLDSIQFDFNNNNQNTKFDLKFQGRNYLEENNIGNYEFLNFKATFSKNEKEYLITLNCGMKWDYFEQTSFNGTPLEPIVESETFNYTNITLKYLDSTINYSLFITPQNITTPYIYEIQENPLILNDTYINEDNISIPLGEYNAKNIIDEYQNGKKTIELSIILTKYYDYNGNLVYNDNIGQYIKVGDIFKIVNDSIETIKDLQYDNIEFIVTETEFSYSGIAKLKLKGKEY